MENCSSKYNFTQISDISESSSGSRWKTKELTYKISKYPSTNRLTKREVDSEIKKALNVWAEVTDLTFEQRLFGKVHIVAVCVYCFAQRILLLSNYVYIMFCTVHIVFVHMILTFCFTRCISTSDLKDECMETEIRLTGWAAPLHMRTSRYLRFHSKHTAFKKNYRLKNVLCHNSEEP